MNSRETILESLSTSDTSSANLPDLSEVETVRYDDLVGQFEKTLELVGGKMIRVASRDQISTVLKSVSVFHEAQSCFSTLEKEAPGNVDLATLRSPRELDGLDLAIVEGEFAVAENASIWVNAKELEQRAVLFLAEHLILVAPIGEIVHNMSDAYRRLSFPSTSYGLFISGPSKTADIEQSLVIGAQGPRSLHVLLIE